MNSNIKDIVITGGGNAAWMTIFNLYFSNFNEFHLPEDINITIIESDDIPNIGVGEGSTPGILRFVETFKYVYSYYNKTEFNFDEIGLTTKLGVKYINWYSDKPTDKYNKWYHPFYKSDSAEYIKLIDNWDFDKIFSQVENYHSKFGFLETMNAYHLDTNKWMSFVKDLILKYTDCNHINGTVEDCKLDKNGNIDSVILTDNTEIGGELFIDCTGFHRKLISKMDVEFEDYSDILKCNRAIATHIDVGKQNDASSYWTTSTAMSSGWSWNIPLKNATGVGYVYSSEFISDEEAEKEFNEYLGIRGDYLKLKWDNKLVKKAWINNCITIGLSSGFFEPLEAFGIQSIVSQNELLFNLLKYQEIDQEAKDYYNNTVFDHMNNFGDFIALHYILNKKNNTDFWKHCREISNDKIQKYFNYYDKLVFMKDRVDEGLYSYNNADDKYSLLKQAQHPMTKKPVYSIEIDETAIDYIDETITPLMPVDKPWKSVCEYFLTIHLWMLLGMNYDFKVDNR